MDSVVQRLHRALAEAVASRRGDVESQPVTVAEIYQELVPYRAVRTSVGFEMNADYEHALLRLLSGEDALVRLEPEEARSHLARELATPNPDVTLFRRYAACDVWVAAPIGEFPDIGGPSLQSEEAWRTPGWLDDAAMRVDGPTEIPTYPRWTESQAEATPPEPAPSPVPAAPAQPNATAAGSARPATSGAAAAPAAGPPPAAPKAEKPAPAPEVSSAAAPSSGDVPRPAPAPRMEREMPPAAPPAGAEECAFCGGKLPAERAIRFCPFCGVDQQLRPCARCGEVLEPGWRYCVNCGAPAPVAAP